MDERGDMRRRGKPQTEGASSVDAELHARLSRLRSELVQCRRTPADRALVDGRLDEVERKLGEAEELAERATDRGSGVANNWQDKCFLIVHEVEAELCMLKPLSIPSFNYQMTPKISLNTRCSISISENLSINGQTRSSDQLGIWSYNINP